MIKFFNLINHLKKSFLFFLQLETSMTYTWTRRESTEAGSPLMALVEQGVNRARYASDCIMALTTEIKKYATDGR